MLNEIWDDLSKGLDAIYRKQETKVQCYMELYSLVFKFCHYQKTDTDVNIRRLPAPRRQPANIRFNGPDFIAAYLYEKLKEFITAYAKELHQECEELHGEQLLSHYTQLWSNFQLSSIVVNGTCSYLNRHWIRREMEEAKSEVFEIYNLALYTWKQVISDQLHHNITSAALHLIEQHRKGEMIQTKLIRDVVESYSIELEINEHEPSGNGALPPAIVIGTTIQRPIAKYQVYKNFFVKRFLEETKNFYTQKSTNFLQYSLPEYMKKVEDRLNEEMDRCSLYLHHSTLKPLLMTCFDAMIAQHLELFSNEFEALLTRQQNEQLGRMFDFFRVSGALDKLTQIFEVHIEREGRAAIQQVARVAINDPKQYITTILQMYTIYNKLVVEAFKQDHGFVEAMDKAFSKFINENEITRLAKRASKSTQLLVLYCDRLLRKSARKVEDDKMDECLEQVMTVFKYIGNKDTFEKLYHKMLCERVVTDASASEEAERAMIAKLKHTCGCEYVNKLERLLTDVALSRDNSNQFKQEIRRADVDFSVIVVMSSVWPLAQPIPIQFQLPPQLAECIDEFYKYYVRKFNGRKLNWVLQMCRGELVSVPKTFAMKYTFVCNTQQMTALVLYNQKEEYKLDELVPLLGLPRDQALAVLQSLVKVDLLKVNGPSGSGGSPSVVTELDAQTHGTSLLRINANFSNKKLKVNLIRAMSTAKEHTKKSEDVEGSVDEERTILVQTAIVRVMKTRKTLKHQQLVAEVLNQLTTRFHPTVPMVKKCIDMLIDKDYLKRADNKRDTYEYLA